MQENVQNIYGIPVIELEKDPIRVRNGVYCNCKGYSVYIPDEVDASTSAFIYYPGAGGSKNDAKVIGDIINHSGFNQIVIVADNAKTDRSTGGARYFELIENIGSANGVEITNIDSMGFSASGPTNFNTLLNNIRTHPENGPHSAVFCDVVGFQVNQEQIDLLVEDEASLLFLEPQNNITDYEKKLAEGGVDVVLALTKGNHADHVTLNREALQNGIISFISGESDELANSKIYQFLSYDRTRGQWYEIPLSEVAEKFVKADVAENPYRYYDRLSKINTELQCNNSFLGGKINTIRMAIKNSNFLSTTSMEYYSSTTQIPNAENEIVQAYFSACAKSLNCLEKDTVKIIEIGNSIKDINDGLKSDAQNLNASIDYYTNSGGSSWTNSSSYGGSSGGSSGGAYSGANVVATGGAIAATTTENTQLSVEEQIAAIKKEFLEYNGLCTNSEENIFVFRDIKKSCKVVIHYNKDEILAVEHYYQYPTQNEATESMSVLKEQYGSKCEDVLRETNTVKVIMDKSEYKDLTATNLIEQYKKSEDMIALMKKEEITKETSKDN